VVDNVIQDHKPPKREKVVEAMVLSMVQRGQCPGMHIEIGHPFRKVLRQHEDRTAGHRLNTSCKPSTSPSQQEGPAPVPGADGAPDDLFTLGDEECGTGSQR
jgi:hypothetical protein